MRIRLARSIVASVAACFLILTVACSVSAPRGSLAMAPGALSLHGAIVSGDLAGLREILATEPSLDTRDPQGRTPLHLAAWEGQSEALRLLIDAGADVNARDAKGRTPLHHAAMHGHMNVAEILIGAGADVSAKDAAGKTVLEAAGYTKPGEGDAAQGEVAPGKVVSIDPAQVGGLIVSSTPYDRRVVGIISGAGGVKPGMIMRMRGSLADGDFPVALVGRVYCWVDATEHPIAPGDLLTTSSTPGYAMKATSIERSHGAVIGKAITGLSEGKDLILVLVSLQ